jgi:hypothetical protein
MVEITQRGGCPSDMDGEESVFVLSLTQLGVLFFAFKLFL